MGRDMVLLRAGEGQVVGGLDLGVRAEDVEVRGEALHAVEEDPEDAEDGVVQEDDKAR